MIKVNVKAKFFKQKQIIDNVQFTAQDREIVAIVGPSGAGKSTLLSIIAGLDSDYQGDCVCSDGIAESANLAYMFQEARLLPWRTVLQNVCLVGDSATDVALRAQALLTRVGLADYLHAYPRQLSGGMKRRVALARAFLAKPKLVLMDEPFVSLDVPSAEVLRQRFIELWRECDSTVVYVTHDLAEALSIADRILFLSPSPAKIIHTLSINEKRPGDIHATSVQNLRNQLLNTHPKLLNGYY